MKHHIVISAKILKPVLHVLDRSKDVGTLLARFWIAYIFFSSGLTKISSWGATIVLFKCNYHVPFLSTNTAALMGTAAEFILPVLLVIGFGGRFFVFCFFIYNIICVVSYPYLMTAAGSAGLNDHISWGLLLMLIMLYGSGRISVDHIVHKHYGHLLRRGHVGEKTHFE
jgi:putative oxidoreductase